MTVRELIEKLETCCPDATVAVLKDIENYPGAIALVVGKDERMRPEDRVYELHMFQTPGGTFSGTVYPV